MFGANSSRPRSKRPPKRSIKAEIVAFAVTTFTLLSVMSIPAPVGGIPIRVDAVPSIVFAVGYGLLLPFNVIRLFQAGKRNPLLVQLVISCLANVRPAFLTSQLTRLMIRQIVTFAIRSSMAFDIIDRTRGSLLIFMQLAFAQSYISVAQHLVPLVKVVLIQPTNPPDTIEKFYPPLPVLDPTDRIRVRKTGRHIFTALNLIFLVPTIFNLLHGTKYESALHNQDTADTVQTFRWAFCDSYQLHCVLSLASDTSAQSPR